MQAAEMTVFVMSDLTLLSNAIKTLWSGCAGGRARAEEADNFAAHVPVNRLVLVVHGIGQAR